MADEAPIAGEGGDAASDAPAMPEIMRAVGAVQAGDRAGGRQALLVLWARLGASAGAMERCTIAHFLADTEDDVTDELAWDVIALAAATVDGDGEGDWDGDASTPALAAFLPSLHLNVGDACRRLGEVARARRHAEAGLRRASALPDDGYGDTVRRGLERLQARLAD